MRARLRGRMTNGVMSQEKKPTDKAKESLERGFGELFKAAESLAGAVKREAKKTGGLTKALDDAGKEIVRAASHVATRVGDELTMWGKKAQESAEPSDANGVAHAAPKATGEESWPKTREEYEKIYDSEGDAWPRSRQEYVDRFGRPPHPKDGHPGFRIATDDE